MKNLLLKIQTELRTIDGIRDRDVFLSVDAGIVPEYVKFPCIGIKDGPVERMEVMGEEVELNLRVEIAIYEKLINGDKEVVSIMETAEKVHTALTENYLDGYIKSVSSQQESPIQVLYKGGMDALMLRKTISYEYEREA